ncbi:glycosyltransferase family 1 protein [Muribacter muris]|uniref:Glycosyltransferase family 1 protein n=1 Tax=Muribacter muris TaxID=67855 RepID=A0A4Y9JYT6_9PAST|nr:glycosyltransferase family 4 protein [Muribacter muris]MBF0784788.1 glycosyltransferase family 4 protein [Muribacter muris]MBF0826653.1 glycosyltransferase family 4 protein [Muribacter muris]TFV11024.1 glycosyltransferase family 1 protein [Muribacter muris]
MKKKIILIGNIGSMMINFRKELIIEFVSNGHEVYCFAFGYTNKEKEQIKNWGAIPKDHYLDLKGLNPIRDLTGIYKLYHSIKSINPDIVFSTFIKPVIFGTIAAKLARVPRIVGMIEGLGNAFTYHKEGQSFKAKIIRLIQVILYKISLPHLNSIIFLNPDDKNDLVDTFNIKVKEMHILGGIGVDLDKFNYSIPPQDNIRFIFIARLLKEKGIFEYLEAAKKIKRNYPEVEFIILGDFDENNPFALSKDSLNDYVNNQIINYYGYVDNVAKIISECSVFVLPSYREGVPRSTQEAMAIGRAIITTDVPGCRETVENGINGFIVPPYSAIKIAEKMTYFIQNPEQIKLMGDASRKIAKHKFNIKDVNHKLTSIILGY